MKFATPKGFRDFLPEDALKRKAVLDKIISTYERFGFDPLQTPTLEYEETFKGKYGEEGDKLMYRFETIGGDKVALRYDQTIPLSRVVAQWGPQGAQKIVLPFKRYQIQSAFRGENTQKGRYREFLQCDADIVGVSSPLCDAELLGLAYEIYKNLGLDIVIKFNDRSLLSQFQPKHLSAIDKLNKIGINGVIEELVTKGLSGEEAAQALEKVKSIKLTPALEKIVSIFKSMGYPEDALRFDPTLVRGLDYYTGIIFEIVLKNDPNGSSLAGGGRYDKMIGQFTGVDLPANGFSIGLDRTVEVLQASNIMKFLDTNTKVLITFNSPMFESQALTIGSSLRKTNINTEIWLDPSSKLEKQLKYASNKNIPYVVIIGLNPGEIILKDFNNGSQEVITEEDLVKKLLAV